MVEAIWREDAPAHQPRQRRRPATSSAAPRISRRAASMRSNTVFRGTFYVTHAVGRRWIAEKLSGAMISIVVTLCQRKLAFAQCFGGIYQRFPDVLSLQIWKGAKERNVAMKWPPRRGQHVQATYFPRIGSSESIPSARGQKIFVIGTLTVSRCTRRRLIKASLVDAPNALSELTYTVSCAPHWSGYSDLPMKPGLLRTADGSKTNQATSHCRPSRLFTHESRALTSSLLGCFRSMAVTAAFISSYKRYSCNAA